MSNIYLSQKGVISTKEAAEKPVLVYGATAYPDYVTTFETFDEFRKWSATLKEKDRIAEALAKTELARQEYQKNPVAAMELQQTTVKNIRSKMEALSAKMSLDPNSQELFLKATVDADPLAGSIFRSAQLFEHPNRTGRRLDIPSWQWWPNLAWFGFNDITSSVRVHAWSMLVLCEHPNFDLNGRWQAFFGGLWWDGEYNLDEWMNDRASSAWCIGF